MNAVLRAARRQPGGAVGVLVLATIAVLAVLAPLIAPYGVREKVGAVYAPPSPAHPLGLDDAGTDMVTLLLWGARTSLVVGFAAAVIAMVIGGVLGLLAGYFGGRTDAVLMRITDYLLVIPDIPLLLIVAAVWGRSMTSVVLIIGLLSWTRTARVVRAQARGLRERVYVKRAKAIGAGHARIIGTHILPQTVPLLSTLTIFAVGNAILTETAIAFLGLGDPSAISWGRLIQTAFDGQALSRDAWWAIVPPGLAVGVLIVACTLVGRALEERLNPRLRDGHLSVKTFRVVS
jgi:peptide/nickel transport system permease protein